MKKRLLLFRLFLIIISFFVSYNSQMYCQVPNLGFGVLDSLTNAYSYIGKIQQPFDYNPDTRVLATVKRGFVDPLQNPGYTGDNTKNNLFIQYSTDYGINWQTPIKAYDQKIIGWYSARYPSISVSIYDSKNFFVITAPVVDESLNAWYGFIDGYCTASDYNYEASQNLSHNGESLLYGIDSKIKCYNLNNRDPFAITISHPYPSNTGSSEQNNIAFRATVDFNQWDVVIPAQWENSKFRPSNSGSYNQVVNLTTDLQNRLFLGVKGQFLNADLQNRNTVGVSVSSDNGASWSDFDICPVQLLRNWAYTFSVNPDSLYVTWNTSDFTVWSNGDFSFIVQVVEVNSLKDPANLVNQLIEIYKESGSWGIRLIANINYGILLWCDREFNYSTGNGSYPNRDYEIQLALNASKTRAVAKWIEMIEQGNGFPTTDIFISTRYQGSSWTQPQNITNSSEVDKCTWIPSLVPDDLTRLPIIKLNTFPRASDNPENAIIRERDIISPQYLLVTNIGGNNLASPVLVSPASGSTTSDLKVILQCSPVNFADFYHFEVSDKPDFSVIVTYGTLASTSGQTPDLVSNTKYYWRVRAINSGDTSSWSHIWSFITPGSSNVNINVTYLSDYTLCPGECFWVYFSPSGNFNPSNEFFVELSESDGTFPPVPRTIGRTTNSSDVSACIPSELTMAGSNYRIRVTSSSPYKQGNIYGQPIAVEIIPVAEISGSDIVCDGNTYTYYAVNSSAGYKWEFPQSQGDALSSVNESQLTVKWKNPSSFELRLIQFNNFDCSDTAVKNISITETPDPSITSDNDNPKQGETVEYSVYTPSGTSNEWSVENGTQLSSNTDNSFNVRWDNAGQGKVTLKQTKGSCSKYVSIDVIISQPDFKITTNPLSQSTFCPGSSVDVSYSVSRNFGINNYFIVQLSDRFGKWLQPITLDSLKSRNSGTIRTKIPDWISTAGSGYRIRVISTNPANAGDDNGSDLSIFAVPRLNIAGESQVCDGSSYEYSVGYNSNYSYTWYCENGNVITNNNRATVIWGSQGKGRLILNQTELSTSCRRNDTVEVDIYPKPVFFISGTQSSCEGCISRFSTPHQNNMDLDWSVSQGGQIIGPANTDNIKVKWLQNGSQSIQLKMTNHSSLCSSVQSIDIKINPPSSTLKVGDKDLYTASSGDKVEIPIILNNPNNEEFEDMDIETELSFNSLLLFPDVPSKENSINSSDKEKRRLKLNIPLRQNIISLPITLKFTALLGNRQQTDINLDVLKGPRLKTQKTTFRLNDICEEGMARLIGPSRKAILSAFPNPAGENCQLYYSLPAQKTGNIFIVDPLGQICRTYTGLTGSNRSITIDLSGLSGGIYNIIMRSGNEMASQKLSILK